MMTVHQVAERLNVSESTVYSLAEQRKLSGYRVGTGRGTWRFTEEDVAAYLERCRSEAATPQVRNAPRPHLKHLKL